MNEFEFRSPSTVAEAAKMLGDGSTLLAGGHTLLPTIKQRLASPAVLVSLAGIPELAGIAKDGDTIRIGAMTRHAEVERSDVVCSSIPALADLAGQIGDAQVRNMGTLGGSIANNDPAADYPAAVLALNATVHTDKRTIAADDFFTGLLSTALEEGEIITAVSFPVPECAAYAKFPQPASLYALVGVFVAKAGGAVRVGVAGAGAAGAFRASELEQALAGSYDAEALTGVAAGGDMLDDLHGNAAYRRHLVTVMAKRAVAAS